MKIFRQIVDDEFGSVDTIGYMLMVTLLAIGGITGLATLRDGIIQEGGDVHLALRSLDQGFSIWVPNGNGPVTWPADVNGVPQNPSNATNIVFKESDVTGISGVPAPSTPGQPPNGISLTVAPQGEGTPATTSGGALPFEPGPGAGGESAPPAETISSPTYPLGTFPAPGTGGEASPAPMPGG